MLETTLFGLLDECVRNDAGPAGFRARIGIGVLSSKGLGWWIGDFTETAEVSRSHSIPENCDATVIVGQSELARLLERKRLPANPTLQVFGDRTLVTRFLQRYVDRQDAFGLRLAHVRESGGRK